MTKEEILTSIDSMTIYKDDVEVIQNLLKYCNDTLFVKIMEEIFLGNLLFSDLKPIFNSPEYTNLLEKSLSFQTAFSEYYKKYSDLLTAKNLTNDLKLVNLMTIDRNIVFLEKKNQIYSILFSKTGDAMTEFYQNVALQDILNNPSNLDNILLSVSDYIVPIDYNYIQLTEADTLFMKQEQISEEEMKKIKSVALRSANKLNHRT